MRVGTGNGIVEEHHEAVAGEVFQRSVVVEDERTDGSVIVVQQLHDFLGVGRLDERREAAKVAEDDGDLAPVRSQQRLVTRRERFGNLRGEELLEARGAFELAPDTLALAQAANHFVERAGQLAQLVALADRHGGGEVAGGHAPRGAGERQHRAADPARNQYGTEQGE